MPLVDHLRELRNRLLVCVVTICATAVVGWIEYPRLLSLLSQPLTALATERGWGVVNLNFSGVTTPFALQLQVALWVGVILASPVWLWQIWAFIVPGLTRKEKRLAVPFIVSATVLFFAGCALAYAVLPTAIRVLVGFTPEGNYNLVPAGEYIAFVTRFILAFGIAFVVPVLLVLLNVAHVLPARIMWRGWRFAVILNFVFSAMMTPTPDAWTMIALAIPMCLLYFGAVGVAYLIDRRRAKDRPDWAQGLADDQASSLEGT